jgi:hypothetical protein
MSMGDQWGSAFLAVRPSRGQGVRDLVREVAALRTAARELVAELGRATPADLAELRRGARRLAARFRQARRHFNDGGCLAIAHYRARALAGYLLVFRPREGGGITARERGDKLMATFRESIDAITVDLSGADLTDWDTLDVDSLGNTVWTEDTCWPPGLADAIRQRSVTLAPGVFAMITET